MEPGLSSSVIPAVPYTKGLTRKSETWIIFYSTLWFFPTTKKTHREVEGMEKEKKQLRSKMKAALDKMPDHRRADEEKRGFDALTELPEWKASANILLFLSMKGEFSTKKIFLEARRLSKKIWAPRISGDTMNFHLLWSPEGKFEKDGDPIAFPEDFKPRDYPLEYNPYGIWEPSPDLPVFPREEEEREASLVVTPGLAFDLRGNRLGRGKGYYDRWFAFIKKRMDPSLINAVGIAYSVQLADEVPHGEKDLPLPLLILGGEVIRCR
jgi:5-formyltetrahydrofolate cyclo-ligase